jgi:hypothetical protein
MHHHNHPRDLSSLAHPLGNVTERGVIRKLGVFCHGKPIHLSQFVGSAELIRWKDLNKRVVEALTCFASFIGPAVVAHRTAGATILATSRVIGSKIVRNTVRHAVITQATSVSRRTAQRDRNATHCLSLYWIAPTVTSYLAQGLLCFVFMDL